MLTSHNCHQCVLLLCAIFVIVVFGVFGVIEVGYIIFLYLSDCPWCYYFDYVIVFCHDNFSNKVRVGVVICCLKDVIMVKYWLSVYSVSKYFGLVYTSFGGVIGALEWYLAVRRA